MPYSTCVALMIPALHHSMKAEFVLCRTLTPYADPFGSK